MKAISEVSYWVISKLFLGAVSVEKSEVSIAADGNVSFLGAECVAKTSSLTSSLFQRVIHRCFGCPYCIGYAGGW